MQRVVDLELWSPPKRVVVPMDGKAVAEKCRAATHLPEEAILGLSFLSDETDIQNLAIMLANGESSKHEFEEFCASQALPADPRNATSAAHFLAFTEGQALAWLHFPSSAVGQDMATSVSKWAASEGFVIRDGQGDPVLSETEIYALWAN